MKYKKSYKIEGKIIAKKDIINMIENVLDKYPKEKDISIDIEAKFKDGSIISDNDCEIFNHTYFEKLKLNEVSIHIRQNYSNEVHVFIYNDSIYSSATIESDNNKLYNSICFCIDENINLMKKQNNLYLLSNKSWGYLVILFSVLLLELLIIFATEYIFKIKIPYVLIYLMLLLMPNVAAIYIERYIEKHYPINQFFFGENSVNKPSTEKSFIFKIVSFIIINIVIPLLITYLTK